MSPTGSLPPGSPPPGTVRRPHPVGAAPRAVTFDATGTLFHIPRLAEIYAEVLRRHGHAVSLADLRGLIPRVWQELACSADMDHDRFLAHPGGSRGWWRRYLERLCEHLETGVPSPFAAAELYARFGRGDAYRLYPDVLPTLVALAARKVPMAVISNWDERLPGVLRELGLAPFFQAVVYSSDVGVEKPHPGIFERALEALGRQPEEVLHVGDRVREDVEGALALGFEAMLLVRPGTPQGRRATAAGDLADLTPLRHLLAG
jgi:putative hydrolase of the HAD superfamily